MTGKYQKYKVIFFFIFLFSGCIPYDITIPEDKIIVNDTIKNDRTLEQLNEECSQYCTKNYDHLIYPKDNTIGCHCKEK